MALQRLRFIFRLIVWLYDKKFVFLCSDCDETGIAMKRTEVVNQISQAIRRVAPTATVILYGSEARGDAREDSDIDVLILLDGDKRDLKHEDELAGELYDIELATGVLVSPVIMLRKQWENRPFKTPFYINVMNEGVRI
jgi:predicted nucleotidyltransferase